MKKWYFLLSRGKDVEFHLFVENAFSTPEMWKMWKTRRKKGWKSPQNRENLKSFPHRFPHPTCFLWETFKKRKMCDLHKFSFYWQKIGKRILLKIGIIGKNISPKWKMHSGEMVTCFYLFSCAVRQRKGCFFHGERTASCRVVQFASC